MDESEFEAIDRKQFEKIMESYIEQFPSLIIRQYFPIRKLLLKIIILLL